MNSFWRAQTEQSIKNNLLKKYAETYSKICSEGCYIWGCGLLGQYAKKQLLENDFHFFGFVSNNKEEQKRKNVFAPQELNKNNAIIIATKSYPDVIEQCKKQNCSYVIYYEELAYLSELKHYHINFEGMLKELEDNKEEYFLVYDLLSDNLSKEIFDNIMMFRVSLDYKYTQEAKKISLRCGIQDFDDVVLQKLSQNTTFFDVGGFDGTSSKDFIHKTNSKYKKIFFFEPDCKCLKNASQMLDKYSDIQYICAGVGDCDKKSLYISIGDGGGRISFTEGTDTIEIVPLDMYICENAYIKVDVEGAEMEVIEGAQNFINLKAPILSMSVYHRPGDIHVLTKKILNYYPQYKIYIRHYSDTIADTRIYFIPDNYD